MSGADALWTRAATLRDLAGALEMRAMSEAGEAAPSPGPQPAWPALGAFRRADRALGPSGAPAVGQLPSASEWHVLAGVLVDATPDEHTLGGLLRLADRVGVPHIEALATLRALLGQEAA